MKNNYDKIINGENMTINYPIKKKQVVKPTSASNRGMTLEYDINLSNEYYLANNIAVVYKKPTPIQVVNVDYPSRTSCVIKEAYYKTPSTTDYNGIFKGKYIDFDCKETISKTSFSLRNIHAHQVEHLKNIVNHGGIGFLIVAFKAYNEYYLVPSNILFKYWDNLEQERKSIPYKEFQENCFLIKEGYLPRLDYLKIIEEKLLD